MQEKHIIKHFAPGWFAVIMGTGGLANIFFAWSKTVPLLSYGAIALAGLADLLYFVALIPWLLRWLSHYDYVRRDLYHPIATNLFVTMPVATAILGTNIYLIWSQYLNLNLVFILTFITWILAMIGVTFFTFFTTFRFICADDSPNPEAINFSWIMSPIANMAVLLIGNPVLTLALQCHPDWGMSIFIANTAFLGIGFFLFIFISAIIFVRLAHHALPPPETTPSFGIFLSAVGLAVTAIIDLSINARKMGLINETNPSSIFALAMWGFGIWIIGIITIITFHQLRREGIPFNLGWWAFVFPLAAYTISSQKIASCFPSSLTFAYAVFLTTLSSLLWFYISFNTLKGVVSGAFFIGKPIVKTYRM